jgi:hypothetical protein
VHSQQAERIAWWLGRQHQLLHCHKPAQRGIEAQDGQGTRVGQQGQQVLLAGSAGRQRRHRPHRREDRLLADDLHLALAILRALRGH